MNWVLHEGADMCKCTLVKDCENNKADTTVAKQQPCERNDKTEPAVEALAFVAAT